MATITQLWQWTLPQHCWGSGRAAASTDTLQSPGWLCRFLWAITFGEQKGFQIVPRAAVTGKISEQQGGLWCSPGQLCRAELRAQGIGQRSQGLCPSVARCCPWGHAQPHCCPWATATHSPSSATTLGVTPAEGGTCKPRVTYPTPPRVRAILVNFNPLPVLGDIQKPCGHDPEQPATESKDDLQQSLKAFTIPPFWNSNFSYWRKLCKSDLAIYNIHKNYVTNSTQFFC